MASAVLHAYRQIVRNGTCKLFRSHNPEVQDGEQSRDFIHVTDIVKLVDHFLTKKPQSGLYNCGTGKARTFFSLMDAIFKTLGRPMKVDWIDTPEQYRKAYQYFTEADMKHTLASGVSIQSTFMGRTKVLKIASIKLKKVRALPVPQL
jgi:ADP-L-glycero-D-manno-heptose 6-epimerase